MRANSLKIDVRAKRAIAVSIDVSVVTTEEVFWVSAACKRSAVRLDRAVPLCISVSLHSVIKE